MPQSVYLVLGVVLIGLLAWWWNTRTRKAAIAVGIVTGLIGLCYLFDQVRPRTDAEQIEWKVKEMAKAVSRKDVDGIFRHISDDFNFQGLKKESLRRHVTRVLESGELEDISVYRFEDPELNRPAVGFADRVVPSRPKGTRSIDFQVKPKGHGDGLWYRCTARFVLDPDGEWRLKDFSLHNPVNGDLISIPQLSGS